MPHTGAFVITLSSVDLGQGLKTVWPSARRKRSACRSEMILVDTADTDTGPHCMGTFASRGTHRVGNAVIMAAQGSARGDDGGSPPTRWRWTRPTWRRTARGRILVKGAPEKKIHIVDLALAAHFKHGKTISGPRHLPQAEERSRSRDRRDGPDSRQAHACTVADVEVDDETGEVDVLPLYNVYEIGRALNPAMVQQQIVGGAWMGISHALYETTGAVLPDRAHGPLDFDEYLMPGPGDLAAMEGVILERPATNGPYGAKGIGEMTANSPIPAIANAIFDAVGVRVDSLPSRRKSPPRHPRREAVSEPAE